MRKFFRLWFPVIAWASLIFYLSGIPHLSSGLSYDFLLRKAAHVTEYFVLAGLLHRALKGSFHGREMVFLALAAGLTLLYGVSDEWHQHFVPGRHASIGDILIDAVGIMGFCVKILLK